MKWKNDYLEPNHFLRDLSNMPDEVVSVIRINLLQKYDDYRKSFDIWDDTVIVQGVNGWAIYLHEEWELPELLRWLV